MRCLTSHLRRLMCSLFAMCGKILRAQPVGGAAEHVSAPLDSRKLAQESKAKLKAKAFCPDLRQCSASAALGPS